MDVRKVNYYEACDQAISSLNRMMVEDFGRLKTVKFDRVNVIQTVVALYRENVKKARKRYYEVAFEAYLLMLALCDIEPKEAHRMAEKAIDQEWVKDVLEQTDFVTLYRFDAEAERKAYRLAEALEVATDRSAEIDRAMKAWSIQIGQYAINVTDYAMIQALQDAGVPMARWVDMHDGRVCTDCRQLDGRVFPVDEIPAKPHMRCRCRLEPVFEAEDDD